MVFIVTLFEKTSYIQWIRRFYAYVHGKNPVDLSESDIKHFM